MNNEGQRISEEGYPNTSRIEAFSDGVFAVAVTLLVFDLKLPQPGATGRLSAFLISQWPAYVAYAVSFVTVGIFWANHHYMFHQIKRSNHLLGMINVLFLMCISFLPFSTALAAAFIRNPGERRTAVGVYVGTFLLSAVLFMAVWLFAANGGLLEERLDKSFVQRINKTYFASISAYMAAFIAAFWSTAVSLSIVVALALIFFLPTAFLVGPRHSSDP